MLSYMEVNLFLYIDDEKNIKTKKLLQFIKFQTIRTVDKKLYFFI